MTSSRRITLKQWRTLDQEPPCIIAHRGASGYMPEHTMEAYAIALAQGADVIEPDLVPSADGILFARHEPSLERSTDIATRAAFTNRRRGTEWFSDDFLGVELDTLRARQPYVGRSCAFDGQFSVPRWQDMLAWAKQAAQALGQPVTLYPELKHPTTLAVRGIDPVPLFIDSVAELPPGVNVWVQCFEAVPLRRVYEATGLPCALLLGEKNDDWPSLIQQHSTWLARLGVNKKLLRDSAGQDSGLVNAAHAAGLRVDAWTFRDDAVIEGAIDGAIDGIPTIREELRSTMSLGVDGLFCDFPDTAVNERSAILSEILSS